MIKLEEKIAVTKDMKVDKIIILGQKSCPACRIIELVVRKIKKEQEYLNFGVYAVSIPDDAFNFLKYDIYIAGVKYVVETKNIRNLPQTHFIDGTTLLGKQLGLPRIPDKLEYTQEICEYYMLNVLFDIYKIIKNKDYCDKIFDRMKEIKELISDD